MKGVTMNMNIQVDKHTIKEIEEIIIPNFVSYFANKCTDISAIAISLQAIIDKVDEVKRNMEAN